MGVRNHQHYGRGVRFRYIFGALLGLSLCAYIFYYYFFTGRNFGGGQPRPSDYGVDPPPYSNDGKIPQRAVVDNTAPFIFIGGIPRSGTTLMRK
jgi:hypothetical protein